MYPYMRIHIDDDIYKNWGSSIYVFTYHGFTYVYMHDSSMCIHIDVDIYKKKDSSEYNVNIVHTHICMCEYEYIIYKNWGSSNYVCTF